jgi:putative PIN family toxin of toxin-antitoxin system
MRVILDTNVLVSALLVKGSVPARIVDAWLEGRFALVTSELQLDEVRRVTRYPRVRSYLDPAEAGSLVNGLRRFAEVCTTLPDVDASSDPADNFLLAMAQAVAADYLVTSDKRGLLALKRYEVTRIVSAGNFMDLLERS